MKMFQTKTVNMDTLNCEKIILINPDQVSSAEAHTFKTRCILVRMQNGDSILLNEDLGSFWGKVEGQITDVTNE